jgi:uncharacterized membrane protein
MIRYGHAFHHGPGVFGWLFLALLAAALVVGVIALVRAWSTPRGHRFAPTFGMHGAPPFGALHGAPVDPALGELRLRYARGEIDRDEYARRAGDLGYPITPPPGPPPPAAMP